MCITANYIISYELKIVFLQFYFDYIQCNYIKFMLLNNVTHVKITLVPAKKAVLD